MMSQSSPSNIGLALLILVTMTMGWMLLFSAMSPPLSITKTSRMKIRVQCVCAHNYISFFFYRNIAKSYFIQVHLRFLFIFA